MGVAYREVRDRFFHEGVWYQDHFPRSGSRKKLQKKARRLIRKPVRPKWRPFSAVVASSGIEREWRHFLPVGRSAS